MPKISALLHAMNDVKRIGRALDSLRACDEVMVIDHGSTDGTQKAAEEHGATVKAAIPGVDRGAYVLDLKNDWVFCLCANEALSEELEASLQEWKQHDPDSEAGYAVSVREETEGGWKSCRSELRLVNRTRLNWTGDLPPNMDGPPAFPGDLMRFQNP
jgi:glycosyltransferase involved in cell wall biosynthesis